MAGWQKVSGHARGEVRANVFRTEPETSSSSPIAYRISNTLSISMQRPFAIGSTSQSEPRSNLQPFAHPFTPFLLLTRRPYRPSFAHISRPGQHIARVQRDVHMDNGHGGDRLRSLAGHQRAGFEQSLCLGLVDVYFHHRDQPAGERDYGLRPAVFVG